MSRHTKASPKRPATPKKEARYRVMGDRATWTIRELKEANHEDPIPPEVIRAYRALKVGEIARVDLGAGGILRIKRVS